MGQVDEVTRARTRGVRNVATSFFIAIAACAQAASAATVCVLTTPPSGSVTVTSAPNTYYAGVGTAPAGSKTLTLGTKQGSGAAFAAGDEALVIQMQDSSIDPSDSSSYGSGGSTGRGVTSDGTSGAYEYVGVTAVTGTTLTISGAGAGGGLVNTYQTAGATGTQGAQTFQIVRVPRYNNVTLNFGASSAALEWNGSSGGVFAIDASGTVTIAGTVSVDGLGFRGGGVLNQNGGAAGPDAPPYDFAVAGIVGYDGAKGEGTVGTPQIVYDLTQSAILTSGSDTFPGGSFAMGSPGNAGGGGTDADGTGNDYNTGGGGGANGGDGGIGGNDWSPNEVGNAAENNGTPYPGRSIYAIGGLGGTAFAPRAAAHVVLGGGGGAGTVNNGTNPPYGGSGGTGGGVILIRAGSVSGGTLSANGTNGVDTGNDGAGGGGAGGSIVVTATGSLSGVSANANGGNGGNAWPTNSDKTQKHGPGGGGGGGVVIASGAIGASVNAGVNGTTLTSAYTYGATSGATGTTAAATPASIPGIGSAAECAVTGLVVTKTGTTQASPGGLVAYSILVQNSGPGDGSGTIVTDPMPAGIAIAGTPTCAVTSGAATCGSVTVTAGPPQQVASTVTKLPASSSVTISIHAVAPTGTLSNPYVNTATIAPPPGQTDPNATTSSVSTTVAQSNGISKTVRNVTTGETATTLDTGSPGDTLEYGLTFANDTGTALANFGVGDATPANTTFVSAACTTPLPAGITACNIASPSAGGTGAVTFTYVGSLAAGTTASFTFRVKIQ